MSLSIENKYLREDINLSFINDTQALPLVISPTSRELDICVWGEENADYLENLLSVYGGILLRGFAVNDGDKFEQLITSVSDRPLQYKERSSPRSNVSGNIYTSTEHPKNEEIFLHNEQSYNAHFPMKIFFYCQTQPTKGGNTPIADTRKIYKHLSRGTLQRFEDGGYRYNYTRCFWPNMGITWQHSFQTECKETVEKYCLDNDISWQWGNKGELKTCQTRHLIARHPKSDDICWFNHCTFFNVNTLESNTARILKLSFAPDQLPNNTCFSNGQDIPDDVIEELKDAYQKEKVGFPWQQGDVLMLDNMLCSHGRTPFDGERSILVGMSDMIAWDQVAYCPDK